MKSFLKRKNARSISQNGKHGVTLTQSPENLKTAELTTGRNHRHGSGNYRQLSVIFYYPIQVLRKHWPTYQLVLRDLFYHRFYRSLERVFLISRFCSYSSTPDILSLELVTCSKRRGTDGYGCYWRQN